MTLNFVTLNWVSTIILYIASERLVIQTYYFALVQMRTSMKRQCSACKYQPAHACSSQAHAHNCVPYSGNFQGRKLSQIGEKYNFHRENFCGLLTHAVPKDTTPPNFMEKTFVNSHKMQNVQKFSPSSFQLYSMLLLFIHTLIRHSHTLFKQR